MRWPAAWWLFQELSGGRREERVELERRETPRARAAWAAHEHVDTIVRDGGAPAVEVILDLLDAAADGAAITTVGSGPLEDLVNRHGDSLADVLERTARQRPDFAASLGSVVVARGAVAPGTAERLTRWLPAVQN